MRNEDRRTKFVRVAVETGISREVSLLTGRVTYFARVRTGEGHTGFYSGRVKTLEEARLRLAELRYKKEIQLEKEFEEYLLKTVKEKYRDEIRSRVHDIRRQSSPYSQTPTTVASWILKRHWWKVIGTRVASDDDAPEVERGNWSRGELRVGGVR
jgi:hypothetical protein